MKRLNIFLDDYIDYKKIMHTGGSLVDLGFMSQSAHSDSFVAMNIKIGADCNRIILKR